MSDFDFDTAVRRTSSYADRTLIRRRDEDLPFLDATSIGGQPLLLDTCVYIDQMRGHAPDLVERVISTRQTNHSTVAIQELMHSVGALDPNDARTASVIDIIRRQITAMRSHRIFTPDADILGRAALMAGHLCRLRSYMLDARLKALQDAVLFLQASKLGFTVLTANIGDFDDLLQLAGRGRVLFYRKV